MEFIAPQGCRDCDVTVERTVNIVPAQSFASVELTLNVLTTGSAQAAVLFQVLGSPDPPAAVTLSFVGQGPVLAVVPNRLDWGRQPLLHDAPKQLTVLNNSAIPSAFECRSSDPQLFWAEPAQATLAPGESVSLTVHVCLDDVMRFNSTLSIVAPLGTVQTVALAAQGVGTSIFCADNLDAVSFGDQFSNRECSRELTLVNRGRRAQRLCFVLDSPPPAVDGSCTLMRGAAYKRMRTPACPNPPEPARSVFGVYPEKLSLEPGEQAVVTIKGLCAAVQV